MLGVQMIVEKMITVMLGVQRWGSLALGQLAFTDFSVMIPT
jgi:hypothetical protein